MVRLKQEEQKNNPSGSLENGPDWTTTVPAITQKRLTTLTREAEWCCSYLYFQLGTEMAAME